MSSHDEFPRITALRHAGRRIFTYLSDPEFSKRYGNPDALDFTLGNPNEMPIPGYTEAMQDWAVPQHERWYGYNTSMPTAQAAAADGLARWTGAPFQSEHLVMTNGGFGAISAAFKAVATPGDEAIFNLPPWFAYEHMLCEAGLTPVKVPVDQKSFDLDIDSIYAAITPRTRIVIVNTPHNPTGKIYPPETLGRLASMLEEASQRIGRRIYLLSDEAYNRIVFDGSTFHTPATHYPWTLVAYSYGKTQLTPGQRIGYLALAPSMPNHEQIRGNILMVLQSTGYAYPSTLLQHAVPDLERLTIDIDHMEQKRDRFVAALREFGYQVHLPEAALWLLPKSPWDDDTAFCRTLAQHDIYVVPGSVCEIPGFFRISLTASDDMIDRSLDGFRASMESARRGSPVHTG